MKHVADYLARSHNYEPKSPNSVYKIGSSYGANAYLANRKDNKDKVVALKNFNGEMPTYSDIQEMKQSSLKHLIAAKGARGEAEDSSLYQISELEAFKFKNCHFVAMDLTVRC